MRFNRFTLEDLLGVLSPNQLIKVTAHYDDGNITFYEGYVYQLIIIEDSALFDGFRDRFVSGIDSDQYTTLLEITVE